MELSCLDYKLTDEERRQFETTGLLMIEGALDQDQVATLTAAVDALYHTQLTSGHDPRTALFYPNFIPANPLWRLHVCAAVHSTFMHGMRSPHTPFRDILSIGETLHLLT